MEGRSPSPNSFAFNPPLLFEVRANGWMPLVVYGTAGALAVW